MMRRLTLVALWILGIAWVPAARAVEPADAPLGLEQAIEIALASNHRLGAADAGVQAAEAGLEAARSARFPEVDLVEVASRTTNPAMVFGNLLGQETFSEENFDPAFLNNPDPLDNFNTRLIVTQPLYTGGKISSGVETARIHLESVSSQRERTRQEVVQQVIEAYSGAILAASSLRVAEEALETARANVGLVRDLVEGGLVVRSDLLQAQVRETEVEEMKIRAESAVEVARSALNLAMGRELSTPLVLPETLPPGETSSESLESLEQSAREARPDLQAAASRVQAAQQRVRTARAGYLPEVGLSGMYEANAEDFVGADGTNWSVMLGARINLFDGFGTRAEVRQAREAVAVAERTKALLDQSVGLEVRQAFFDLRASRSRIEQARKAVALAEESLRLVQDRYREGLTTLVELLDAETALTRARTREVAAQRDVLLDDANLKLAAGRL